MAAIRTVPCSSVRSCGSVTPRRAGRDRVGVGRVHVRDLERDVDDAVAVLGDVLRAGRAGVHRAGEHEPGRAAGQHVLGVVADSRCSGPRYATQVIPNAVE